MLETDLLVIGAGAAGMTAALVGALEGLKVVICEKSDMVGGTTATSAGTVWIPGSRQSEAAGVPDSIEVAKTYLAAILGEDANDARLAAFLATGPAVLDYLAAKNQRGLRAAAGSSRLSRPARRRDRRPGARRRCRSTDESSARILRGCGRRAVNSWCSAA